MTDIFPDFPLTENNIALLASLFGAGIIAGLLLCLIVEGIIIPANKRYRKKHPKPKKIYPIINTTPPANPFDKTATQFFHERLRFKIFFFTFLTYLSIWPFCLYFRTSHPIQTPIFLIYLITIGSCAFPCLDDDSLLVQYLDYRNHARNPRYKEIRLPLMRFFFRKYNVLIIGNCGQSLKTNYSNLREILENPEIRSAITQYSPITEPIEKPEVDQ